VRKCLVITDRSWGRNKEEVFVETLSFLGFSVTVWTVGSSQAGQTIYPFKFVSNSPSEIFDLIVPFPFGVVPFFGDWLKSRILVPLFGKRDVESDVIVSYYNLLSSASRVYFMTDEDETTERLKKLMSGKVLMVRGFVPMEVLWFYPTDPSVRPETERFRPRR